MGRITASPNCPEREVRKRFWSVALLVLSVAEQLIASCLANDIAAEWVDRVVWACPRRIRRLTGLTRIAKVMKVF